MNEKLSAVYSRIGEFFANQETTKCIIAYNKEEYEIMEKCGLQCIGKAHHGEDYVDIFILKTKVEKHVYTDLETIPQIQPIKTPTWVTPSPYFPPNTRGYELGSGPAALNCKF